jgi:hypothetical protein
MSQVATLVRRELSRRGWCRNKSGANDFPNYQPKHRKKFIEEFIMKAKVVFTAGKRVATMACVPSP